MQYKWRSLAALILLLTVFFPVVQAQQTSPDSMPGCIYNATPPVLTNRQTTVWQCDSSGRLITSGGAPTGVLNLASYLTAAQLTAAQAGVNTQDLTTQITAWLAACPATGCLLVVPPGYFYSSTCGFSIPNSFTMIGAGVGSAGQSQAVSTIVCGSTSAKLFTVTAKSGMFRDITFLQNGGTAILGSSAVFVTGSDPIVTISYENIGVNGFYDAIDSSTGEGWHLSGSILQNFAHWGVRVRNVNVADAGDWTIDKNNFYALVGSDAGIRWESSGDGHIIGNSFPPQGANQKNCISVDTTGNASVEIFIQGNKCELSYGPGIAVYNGWRFVNIDGNTVALISTADSSFTGAISGNTLTVSVSATNQITQGQVVAGAGVPRGVYIKSFGTGTGGLGTYTLNVTLQLAITAEAMTASTPAILCSLCTDMEVATNTLSKLGGVISAAPAILLDQSQGSVGANNISYFSSPLMLSQGPAAASGINFQGVNAYTLVNLPDPTQLNPGSRAYVSDATSAVEGQPFVGGGKLSASVYSDGARWLSAVTLVAQNYIGPGDIKTYLGWWGLRAYSAATAGTKAANICNTVVGDGSCTDVNTLVNGQLDMAAVRAAPLNCTGTFTPSDPGACNIKTIYNKAGANCTTDTTCDMTQATITARPRLVFASSSVQNSTACNNPTNGTGQIPCMFRSSANTTNLATVGTISIAQPYTIVGVAVRQINFNTAYHTILVNGAGNSGLFIHNANNLDLLVNNVDSAAITQADERWHAFIGVWPNNAGASAGTAYVDGVSTAVTLGTTAFSVAAVMRAFGDPVDALNGSIAEFGIASGAFSAGDAANVNANMRAYYGLN